MPVYRWLTLIAAFLAASCVAPEPLIVTSHLVRDQVHEGEGRDPMARNEKLRRLHGAVSMEERKNLLGQYYTIRWNDSQTKHGPPTITFEYQQGGSDIKSFRREFPKFETSGTAEFSIIGDNYFNNGRVLAWRATLRRGEQVIATRQSYLWQ